ncbi:MAG: UDP-N-acetylglucosamine 2-epimerase (non-hydrolyzing) [Betaproteobacteria bacterium]|nr:UDP-N-acetylglucosamine 2-epimerase (non-hydrolyzing) [Betaproteobacteria bacterium]
MKVIVVVGTRPEVIKMAPVISALRVASIDTLVCASGQHREMLTQTLDVFSIRPDIALDAMRPRQTLNSLAARLLADFDAVLGTHEPDWVLVQGDTTTAFCAGLAAFHRGIRVGHVEAGLRTGDLTSPFPEEANRCLLARIVARHFAPTGAALQSLLGEGIPATAITVTGNTVVDAVDMAQGIMAAAPTSPVLADVIQSAATRPLVLVTCHRRENFGTVLAGICHLLKRLATNYPDFYWVFPTHLNPNVREPVTHILGNVANLSVIDPVDYLSSLALIERAALVVSDSGGIQEEAPSFGVPVVVMRSLTERREGVQAGFATLAGQSPDRIEAAITGWLDHPERKEQLRNRPNPYGDGKAAARIVATLSGNTVQAFHG